MPGRQLCQQPLSWSWSWSCLSLCLTRRQQESHIGWEQASQVLQSSWRVMRGLGFAWLAIQCRALMGPDVIDSMSQGSAYPGLRCHGPVG